MECKLEHEIHRRKTFAIISHPDAGKTTLTEKLLLYGGAVHLAGSVKARKNSRHAVSDWMDIEKQRGISVTSSVLQFGYAGKVINILDTPGHQDFCEDTYRTLVAADSAVMLIDGSKGVEPQTVKLFHVCRLRGIPVFTFVNKMDRASRHPFDLMQEIEDVLGMRSCPMNWPIGTDGDFKGIYDRQMDMVRLYEAGHHGQVKVGSRTLALSDPALEGILGGYYISRLIEETELLDGAVSAFSHEEVLKGDLTPIFFGSAMNNFGVEAFLSSFLDMAPSPSAKISDKGVVEPSSSYFSGFVFKIQANMNRSHRDRIAFIRIVSGEFKKGLQVSLPGCDKPVRLSQPQSFMADGRDMVEEAYPGDIIGVYDPGIFKLGMTLCGIGGGPVFQGLPVFPSEHFARVSPKDSLKRKQFIKGISQLSEEGTIQIFRQEGFGVEMVIAGVVGILQFEVMEHRMKNEYNVELDIRMLDASILRWISHTQAAGPQGSLNLTAGTLHAKDCSGADVLLFDSQWAVEWALGKNKGLILSEMSEFHTD